MSKWIEFQLQPRPKGMKTAIYNIWTKDGSIFENQCLGDIIAFIDKLMEDRKK